MREKNLQIPYSVDTEVSSRKYCVIKLTFYPENDMLYIRNQEPYIRNTPICYVSFQCNLNDYNKPEEGRWYADNIEARASFENYDNLHTAHRIAILLCKNRSADKDKYIERYELVRDNLQRSPFVRVFNDKRVANITQTPQPDNYVRYHVKLNDRILHWVLARDVDQARGEGAARIMEQEGLPKLQEWIAAGMEVEENTNYDGGPLTFDRRSIEKIFDNPLNISYVT